MFSRFRKRFIKIFKSNNRDSNDILAVPSCPRELVIKPVEEQVVSEPTVQEHLTREINASTKHKLSKVLLRETLIIAHNKAEEEARKEILKRKLENVQLREKARIQEKETQMEVQRQTEKRMKEKELWVSLANATQEEDKKELMKRKVRNIMLLEKLKAEDRETEVQVQRQREERQREIERWKALEKEAQEENNREIRKRKERNLLLNKNMEMEKEQKLKNIEQQRRMKELELEAQKKDDAAMREEIAMQQPKEMEIIRSTEEEAQKLSGPSEQSPDDVPVDKQKDAGSQKASPPISLPGEEEQTEEESEKPEAANQDQNKSVTRKKEKKMKIRRGKPQDSCVDVPKVSKMRTPYCQVVAKLDKALNMTDLDSSMAQYEPPRIEDFQLQSFLGEGSFGKVYKAQHRETGEIIALKTLALCEMNDTSVFKCVALEQRILRLVSERQWPFLTGLVCSFQTEHYMCLGMEYAEGGTLDSYLSEGGLPLERVRFYSACIVLGLQFLHEHNIAHRDLKPENVLLYGDGYVKLADFGLCREGMAFNSTTSAGGGTLFYMALEMFRGQYTRAVDWWALGVTMYNMLTGSAPFRGLNTMQFFGTVTTEEPDYPVDITEDTHSIIAELLEKNPRYRLGSGEDDAEEVKNSPFFEGLDWEALENKQIQAPFIPERRTTKEPEGSLKLTPVGGSKPLREEAQWAVEELFYARSSSSDSES